MTDSLEILLTNDDGIDSRGLSVVYEALSAVADVTVVAPADDQSAVGRSISHTVDVVEHDLGYAVDGTPADCVVAGLAELAPDPDLVISGCNEGANFGEYVLGRSGTISAAVEAAFFDVPAIATSLYVPVSRDVTFEEVLLEDDAYREARRVTEFLATRVLETDVFERAAYLNVNAPVPDGDPAPIEVTRPSKRYEMDAERDGGEIHLRDRIWERMDPGTLPDPEGTDRRAVVEGRVSVTPLTAPHSTTNHDALDGLAARYADAVGAHLE